jgi:hypothetical protein
MRLFRRASLLAAIVARANAFALPRHSRSSILTRSSNVHRAASQLEQLASMTVGFADFNRSSNSFKLAYSACSSIAAICVGTEFSWTHVAIGLCIVKYHIYLCIQTSWITHL